MGFQGTIEAASRHFRTNDEWRGRNDEGTPRMSSEKLIELSIPCRSPGHAFVPMTKWMAGLRGAAKSRRKWTLNHPISG